MPLRSKRLYFGLSTLLLLVTLLAAMFGAARIGYDHGYASGQAQRKREHIVTRVYDVNDLLLANSSSGHAAPNAAGDRDALTQLLRDSVDPGSWEDSGGPGVIHWLDGPPVALVISHSEAAHEQVLVYLRILRANQVKAQPNRPVAP